MLSYRTIEPYTLELLNKLSQLSILSDMRLVEGHWSSRAREFHPHPLTEPCVKVSPHTALHIQRFVHRHNLGV